MLHVRRRQARIVHQRRHVCRSAELGAHSAPMVTTGAVTSVASSGTAALAVRARDASPLSAEYRRPARGPSLLRARDRLLFAAAALRSSHGGFVREVLENATTAMTRRALRTVVMMPTRCAGRRCRCSRTGLPPRSQQSRPRRAWEEAARARASPRDGNSKGCSPSRQWRRRRPPRRPRRVPYRFPTPRRPGV